MNYILVYCVLN